MHFVGANVLLGTLRNGLQHISFVRKNRTRPFEFFFKRVGGSGTNQNTLLCQFLCFSAQFAF